MIDKEARQMGDTQTRTETEDLLRKLTATSKLLKLLREKRDRLREELAGTEKNLEQTAAEIQNLTAALADTGMRATGNGKK